MKRATHLTINFPLLCVVTLMWHVRDTLWRADVSVCYQLHLLFCDSTMKDCDNWTERVFADQMTEWGLDCLRPGPWHGPLSPYLGDYFTARHYCCYYRQERFGWKLWQYLPRWAQCQVTLLLIIQQLLLGSAAPWLNVIINTRTLNNNNNPPLRDQYFKMNRFQ